MPNEVVLFTCTNPGVQKERVLALALLLTNNKVKSIFDESITKVILVG
jgi:hypothetical protein